MYFSALKDLPGQEAAILSYIDPLTAVLISTVFLGEHMTVQQMFGGILILGFTLWNEEHSGADSGAPSEPSLVGGHQSKNKAEVR